jgi:predicted  nucleic acid-binding Zn-ribbon protein
MKLEANSKQVRALLDLASAYAPAEGPESGAPGGDAATRLPPALLERYESLLAAGRRPAVVAIVDGTCSGCHVRLPTSLEYQAGRALALYTCPRCRRLLYAPRLLEGQEDPAPEGRPARRIAARPERSPSR